MRITLFFMLFFLMMSCQEKSIKKPSFLIGDWVRVNEKPNVTTYEIWKTDFTGLGVSLQEKDTTFKEILSIVDINDTLHLKVVGVNKTPTFFKFTQQTDTSFTAENPTHNFPTKINYWLVNDTLKAKVSNNDFAIDFSFVKR